MVHRAWLVHQGLFATDILGTYVRELSLRKCKVGASTGRLESLQRTLIGVADADKRLFVCEEDVIWHTLFIACLEITYGLKFNLIVKEMLGNG